MEFEKPNEQVGWEYIGSERVLFPIPLPGLMVSGPIENQGHQPETELQSNYAGGAGLCFLRTLPPRVSLLEVVAP